MRRTPIALIVLILIAAAAPAATAQVSDPAALKVMAEVRLATGGAALDRPEAFRERGVMTRDGRSGTYETFADLRALRSAGSQTFDGKTRWAGFDGEAHWRTDERGAVVRSTDPATVRSERLGTYLTVSGYLFPDRFPAAFAYKGRRELGGRDHDVVAVTPRDADTADLWIDRATRRVAHIEATDGRETVKGDVGDYRRVAGTWVGYALDMAAGGHVVRLRLRDFEYVPLAEARLGPDIVN